MTMASHFIVSKNNYVLWHDSALGRLYWAGDKRASEMSFVMNHVTSVGSIARPVDQKSNTLPLYHGYPL